MKKQFKTSQEEFWSGMFGENYIDRNKSKGLLASNISLFSKIISRTENLGSVLELGANIGMNMMALKSLLPDSVLTGVEINSKAASVMSELEFVEVFEGSAFDFQPAPSDRKWDLVFTKGVLIHINPEELHTMYDQMVRLSSRYVMIAEYYNPAPVSLSYRGHEDRLFKRDFAGELMERHSMKLLDYGFVYHKDNHFPQDDITWFLMEKS